MDGVEATLRSATACLEVLHAPQASLEQRKQAELHLQGLAVQCATVAARALQQQAVVADVRLSWFLVTSLERHVLSQFWLMDDHGKAELLQEVDRIWEHSGNAVAPAVRSKLCSLRLRLLCWRASEGAGSAGAHAAAAALSQLAAAPPPTERPDAQRTLQQLLQCRILVEDLYEVVSGSQGFGRGQLPASCVASLREFYSSGLRAPLCRLAGAAMTRNVEQQQDVDVVVAAMNLLSQVVGTSGSGGANAGAEVPVHGVLQTLLGLMQLGHQAVIASGQAAVRAVCGMPILPAERLVLRSLILQVIMAQAANPAAALPLSTQARLLHDAFAVGGVHLSDAAGDNDGGVKELLIGTAERLHVDSVAASVVCRLELWMAWLNHTSQMEDLAYDDDDPEASLRLVRAKAEALLPAIQALVQLLLDSARSLPAGEWQRGQAAGRPINRAALDHEAQSGGQLEELIAQLTSPGDVEDASAGADEDEDDEDDDAPMLDAPTCALLVAWETSEAGVFYAYCENVIAQCAAISGPELAACVWQAALASLESSRSAMGGSDQAQLVQSCWEVHVRCQAASRCMRFGSEAEPATTCYGAVLAWLQNFVAQMPLCPAEHVDLMLLAGSSVMRCLSGLAFWWYCEMLRTKETPNEQQRALALGAFQVAVAAVELSVRVHSSSSSDGSAAALLASNAADAMHTITRLTRKPSKAVDCGLSQALAGTQASEALSRLALALALGDLNPSGEGTPAGAPSVRKHLSARAVSRLWESYCDVQVMTRTVVPKGVSADWQGCATAFQPVQTAWERVLGAALEARQPGDWAAIEGRLAPLCDFAVTACLTVGRGPRPPRQGVYGGLVQGVISKAVPLLERAVAGAASGGSQASACAALLCKLSLRAMQSMLAEMPVEAIAAVLRANLATLGCAGATQSDPRIKVLYLLRSIVDSPSPHVNGMLPDFVHFVASCASQSLPHAPASPPHARLACHALTALCCLVKCRFQVLSKGDPQHADLPLVAADHLASFLHGASTAIPAVNSGLMLDLLMEFFDMSKQAQLLKGPKFVTVQPQLQVALLEMLAGNLWQSISDQLLDLLYSFSKSDGARFVQQALPAFIQSRGPFVAARSDHLTKPFADQVATLEDNDRFTNLVGAFINDLRFFERVSS